MVVLSHSSRVAIRIAQGEATLKGFEKTVRLLAEAVAMYRKIGMPKHVEMAEALLGEV